MKKKTLLCLLLTALLLSPSLTGCAGDTKETTADTTSDTTDTVAAETEPERYAADLPARDFGGETFNFYTRSYEGVWTVNDFLTTEMTGEVINDALYERQSYMEETYNLQLVETASLADDILANVKTFISAGDSSYQGIIGRAYNMADLTLEGMLMDLTEVDNIDLSQPWWGQTMNDSISIGGKLHYATGDLLIVDNKAERIYYYNKDLATDLGIPDLYATVREGNWTIDTFMQYNELAKRDVDGDGKMTKGTDVFGTIAQPQHLGFGLYMGAGELVVAKDEKDIPYFRAATSEALDIMVTIADKVGASSAILCADSSEEPKNLDCFQEGLTLFFPEVLKHIETMREYDIDIGILPNPKLSAEQEDYYCYADGYCVNAVAIPITNTESEKVGFVLEAMAAESKNGLTPAYFEVCLSDKYVRDQDSVEMLEMVMDSGILDLGEVFRWNNIASVVSNAIYKGDAIVSTIAANESQIQSSIDKTLEALGIE